jgi:glycosyltransferase involved in cell wall biosynthesis
MTESGPLVSVLTPSLDQVEFVRDCLESVRRQDYRSVEQVVVDGGSRDGTLDVAAGYEGDRLRLIVLPGSSQAQALNAALAASRGEIIAWLNTDDAFFSEDTVSSVVAAFRAAPGCKVVYGDGASADERGRVLRHDVTDAAVLRELPLASPLAQPAVFVRREALRTRFIREDLHLTVDYELWLYLASTYGWDAFHKVDRMLAINRDHPRRKVQERWDELLRELPSLADEYGLRFGRRRRPAQLLRAWRRRLEGLPDLLELERRYRPAFSYSPDPAWRRVVRQAVLPQRLLRFV